MARENLQDRDHWNQRYTERPWPTDPSPWLVGNAALLGAPGRALDIAGGTGRNAIWLAARGWDVTITDVSNVAIDLAVTRAEACDVTLHTLEADLVGRQLPNGPWDAIMVFHYLDRALFPMFPELLEPGGVVIGSLATVRNLERNERPPLPYLLDEGELPGIIGGLELVVYDESWEEGHHDARFVARR
ncbi:MAG: class I SAM-dependent methyltransferase [Actinomycetota bacterium]